MKKMFEFSLCTQINVTTYGRSAMFDQHRWPWSHHLTLFTPRGEGGRREGSTQQVNKNMFLFTNDDIVKPIWISFNFWFCHSLRSPYGFHPPQPIMPRDGSGNPLPFLSKCSSGVEINIVFFLQGYTYDGYWYNYSCDSDGKAPFVCKKSA